MNAVKLPPDTNTPVVATKRKVPVTFGEVAVMVTEPLYEYGWIVLDCISHAKQLSEAEKLYVPIP